MNIQEISDKIFNLVDKGAEVSKDAFEKAGNKVQEFSDKSIVLLEKKQLEAKLNHKFEELGKAFYSLLNKKNKINFTSNEDEGEIKKIKAEICSLEKEIKSKKI